MMVDYDVNLEGWLEDATLFHNESSDYSLNFDLLDGKANNEAARVTDFNDLPWYEEKVDLSILEDPKNVQLTETDINELLSILGSTSNTSYLSSVPNLNDFNVLNYDLNDLQSQVASPDSSTDLSFSPEYETISEAGSPASFTSDVPVESDLYSELSLSPGNASSSVFSADENFEEAVPTVSVSVTVCDIETDIAPLPVEALSIEEVSNSVRKRKYVNNGKEIPKVHVSLRNSFHPYSKATSRRPRERTERKKVQNKEAAARYRVKKREEEKGLSGEVSGLEAEQRELKSKQDDLVSEIKYLKKLMREVLQKKGIL